MNEKEGNSAKFKFLKSRRGQVTVFILLGIIIVSVAAVIYFLYPQIKSTFGIVTDPQSYIQTCMQDKINEVVKEVSLQGGSVNPGHFILYYNSDLGRSYPVEYLCYTNKDSQPCTMQQPLLQPHIESEIANGIKSTADTCFSNLQKSYQNRGYTASLIPGNITVELIPNQIKVTFNDQLTLTRGNTQRYTEFNMFVNSNLYELSGIANSILQWEVQYGDANTPLFMMYYTHLLMEKKLQTDGTKVYILTDLDTGEKFQFATRSYAWPPGYGGNQ
ncbi:MAG: hypothetical protein KGH55_02730 [Nanoarchaeota archaeon]|nr:hypothetical protein [Nanoarchaeota archaeon]